MMASNMSESDESGNDVDDDEELIVPRPHYYSIWDCPHINKFTLEENGVVKNGWIRTTGTEKEKERATRRTAIARGGAGAKTKTTEAAVEAMAVAGGVDTGAATTATTATMVTATTMTRLNFCDASTEEKERPSNLSWMHATIK
jgi:hypothetical protein